MQYLWRTFRIKWALLGHGHWQNRKSKWVTGQTCFACVTGITCIGCKRGMGSHKSHHYTRSLWGMRTLMWDSESGPTWGMFPAYALDFSSIISISVLFSLILLILLCHTKHYWFSEVLPLLVTGCPKILSLVLGAGPKEVHALLHISSDNRGTQSSYRTGSKCWYLIAKWWQLTLLPGRGSLQLWD